MAWLDLTADIAEDIAGMQPELVAERPQRNEVVSQWSASRIAAEISGECSRSGCQALAMPAGPYCGAHHQPQQLPACGWAGCRAPASSRHAVRCGAHRYHMNRRVPACVCAVPGCQSAVKGRTAKYCRAHGNQPRSCKREGCSARPSSNGARYCGAHRRGKAA